MLAKFPGHCTCGAPFLRGDPITYDHKRSRVTACPACLDPDVTGGEHYDPDAALAIERRGLLMPD